MQSKIDVIQGLRGVSVISVMLFHLAPEIFTLGYLGVDIFFVISGFVITKSISENIQKGTFSLQSFYARRILRLYPALLIFIFISIFLIFFLTIIDTNFKIYLRTAISSLIGISNFYLISINNDYFNPVDENPFVHTWSLAVEEQFYLFYPIFLLFVLNYFYKKKIKIFLFLIVASLTFIFLINDKNIFTEFYSIFSRFWELLIGCMTFFLMERKKKDLKNINLVYLIIPLSILLYFFENIQIKLLLISISSMLIIMNYKNNNFLNNILKNKILLHIGKISYSLYLWHMVVFFLLSFYFLKIEYYFLSIVSSLIIANISYRYVEVNFTKNEKLIKKLRNLFQYISYKLFIPILASIIIILVLNVSSVKKIENNFFNSISKLNIHKEFKDFNKIERNKFSFACHENFLALDNIDNSPKCFLKNNQNTLLIFFGDSHTWTMHPFVKDFNLESDKLKLSFNSSSFLHPIFRPDDVNIKKIKKIIEDQTKNYETIHLILSIDHLFSKNLTENKINFQKKLSSNYNSFVSELSSNSKIKIFLLEDKPSTNLTMNQCLTLKKINFSIIYRDTDVLCDYSKKIVKDFQEIKYIFKNLDKNYDNFYLIETNNYFCDEKKCFFHNADSKPFFYDKKHLTYDSAKQYSYFVEKKIVKLLERLK
mgnify:FL=1|tara:strand:+ start:18489 stop:20447 length:1959 start_codon:yes stop_codon:yes gene_type:complete